MGARELDHTRNRKTRTVCVLITEDLHTRLLKDTRARGLTKAGLSCAFIALSLAKLERGNEDVHRAIKTSRDSEQTSQNEV